MINTLAAIQHEIWAHWMKYLFSQCTQNKDGSVTIPANKVFRWKRQMTTNYEHLTTQEQKSDIEQAEKIMKALDNTL